MGFASGQSEGALTSCGLWPSHFSCVRGPLSLFMSIVDTDALFDRTCSSGLDACGFPIFMGWLSPFVILVTWTLWRSAFMKLHVPKRVVEKDPRDARFMTYFLSSSWTFSFALRFLLSCFLLWFMIFLHSILHMMYDILCKIYEFTYYYHMYDIWYMIYNVLHMIIEYV